MGEWIYSQYVCPIGKLIMAGEGQVLTGLWIEGQSYFGSKDHPIQWGEAPVFEDTRRWLRAYFAGEDPGPTPPLAPEGSPFRRQVWEILRAIPRGQTTTYGAIAGELAKKNGKPAAPQAVGGAVGHNPISILIPCHRVLGADGSLTGYAGGLEKKEYLLRLEKIL